ncbi:MAG: 50S ribosomal protein L35 [Planctomycetes bacterium]|nr:50S ribosomal protein L35 [Planctomycetota bacterium]
MPKQKTVKALTKRLRATRNKKLLHHITGKRHLLQRKSRKQKRRIETNTQIKYTSLVKRIIKEIA